MKSLRERLISSGAWSLAGNVISQLLRFGSNLVLTKLLMPDAFGLMGIVTTVHVGVTLLSDAGIHQSLVTNAKGEDPLFRGTAWSIQIIRGLLIGSAIVLSGAALGLAQLNEWVDAQSTLAHPFLPALLAAYGLLPVLQGLSSTKSALAQRKLDNKWPTICGLAAQIITFPITVWAAYEMRSVWALFIGAALSTGLSSWFTHVLIDGSRDRMLWHRPYAIEMAHFGRWIMLASCIGFLASNGDKLILSTLVNADLLGQYTIALLICSSVQTIFSMGLGALVLPALSNSRGELNLPSSTMYRKVQFGGDLFLIGSAAVLAFAAKPIIDLLYGPLFSKAGDVLFVLALGMIGMRLQILEQYFIASNQPKYMSYANGMRAAALLIFTPLAHEHHGFMGGMTAIAASQFAGWPLLLYQRHVQGLAPGKDDIRAVAIFLAFGFFGHGLGMALSQLTLWWRT